MLIHDSRRSRSQVFILAFALFFAGCSGQYMKKGDMFYAQNRWDEALDNYSEALEKDPYSKEARLKVEMAKFEAAMFHLKEGEKALSANDYDKALLEAQVALALMPDLKRAALLSAEAKKRKDALFYYNTGLDFLRDNKKPEARASFKKALSLNPQLEEAEEEMKKVEFEKKTVMGGYELNLRSNRPITLKFKSATITSAFDIISKLSGINFIFDEGLKPKSTSLFLENATFEQALELLLMTNNLFHKVVNENTIIIIPDTKAKRQQYEDMMIHTFYLSNLEAKKAVNLLRTLLKIKSVYVNEELNTIVVRDTPEVIALADKILQANDLTDSEVMLDVEILEVQRNESENLGIDLTPDEITARLKDGSQAATSRELTYSTLKRFSRSDMLFTIPDVAINLQKSNGNVNLLANPKIRVLNNKKAKIHIGDRIPIVTVTTNNGVTADNVQYVDVGVKLNVEPLIHLDREVSMKLNLEISSLGPATTTSQGSTVYQIGTRNAETELRLHDGETQVIGGLIQDEERSTTVKIPFLGDIPVLGRLFSSVDERGGKTDILLSITPHIVRLKDTADPEVRSIWSGREQEFSSQAPFESFTQESPGISLPDPGEESFTEPPPGEEIVPGQDMPPTIPGGGPGAGIFREKGLNEPGKDPDGSRSATISWQ